MARAGVVTEVQIMGGMAPPVGTTSRGLDFSSPTTWAWIFVILAVLYFMFA